MTATRQTEIEASADNRHDAPLWTYGESAAARAEEEATAACGHETAIEKDGETHCWRCFKADLEFFVDEEDTEDE